MSGCYLCLRQSGDGHEAERLASQFGVRFCASHVVEGEEFLDLVEELSVKAEKRRQEFETRKQLALVHKRRWNGVNSAKQRCEDPRVEGYERWGGEG
jgi:hypothetical protein